MQYWWNYDQAVQQFRLANVFKLNFILLGNLPYPNNGQTEKLESEFNPEDEATGMITFL